MKITKLLEFFVYNNPGISWKGTLRPPSLSTNRTWELPDRDGTLWLNTDTVTIPWTTQFEYSTPGVSVWRTIPAGSRYVSGVVIGAGGGSGSGARGNTNANRTGGSSGSAGGVTPFTFDLQSIATMCGCFLSALQYEEVVGAAGVSGAAITTDNTDGANGASGGISSIRFRATPGQGFATIFLGCRAVGGAGGLGGRRGATVTTGGAVQSLGATFPGQIGTAGRSTTGNSSPAFNSGAAAGGGGAGAAGGSTVGAPGGNSGPACYDQAGDFTGQTVPGTFPNPGNARTVIPSGIAGSGGAGGGYAPGFAGVAGGAGFRGGSGGGGGASDNGQLSGAGGPSGNGYILMKFSPYPI